MISRTRDGRLVETYDGQGKTIERLYGTAWGRRLLGILVQPWVSNFAGWCLERGPSRLLVGPFIRKNHLDLSDYPARQYRSFNDFFTRKILPEKRPVDQDPARLIAPCDGKLTAIPIGEKTEFTIKGVSYTLNTLLRREAPAFQGGTLLLFRLTVDDYHRYCFAADGTLGPITHIAGVYHTVNPRAAAQYPIYRENTREYQILQTEEFGDILVMEVGALLVGRIVNEQTAGAVRRGQEKGHFAFGGSTVVLILEKNRVQLDRDILENSQRGEETLVKMGERIGTKCRRTMV
jgi:phosphatidylserine decarboxylase